MSKRILIFSCLLITSLAFYAQRDRVEYLPTFDKRKLHYGFYLGMNKNDFKLNLRDTQGGDGYPTRLMCDFKYK